MTIEQAVLLLECMATDRLEEGRVKRTRQDALDALIRMCMKCGSHSICGGTGCWSMRTISEYLDGSVSMDEVKEVLKRLEPKGEYTGLRADALTAAIRKELGIDGEEL